MPPKPDRAPRKPRRFLTKPDPAPGEPLRAIPARDLSPGRVDAQVALYEAALSGDHAEFERLRRGAL